MKVILDTNYISLRNVIDRASEQAFAELNEISKVGMTENPGLCLNKLDKARQTLRMVFDAQVAMQTYADLDNFMDYLGEMPMHHTAVVVAWDWTSLCVTGIIDSGPDASKMTNMADVNCAFIAVEKLDGLWAWYDEYGPYEW